MHRLIALMSMVALMFGAVPGVFAEKESPLIVQVLPRPSGSIPIGAQRVEVLSLRLTAPCPTDRSAQKDVRVTSITVHHKGLGSAQDIERLYGMQRGIRRTRTSMFRSSDNAAVLRFPSLTIAACMTETVSILADFRGESAAAGEHIFSITASSDVQTDPVVAVQVNPEGVPTMTRPVGESAGTVSVDLLDLVGTLNYGNARNVARLQLRGDRSKDERIVAITFVNNGTAQGSDLQNFYLETSGHTILSPIVPSMDGDRIRIPIDPPLILRRNETRLLYLRADIRASRRRTVRFVIEAPGDVEASPVR